MAQTQVKGYSRKGKNGKTVSVKEYKRRVGYKGKISPDQKKSPKGTIAGQEYQQKRDTSFVDPAIKKLSPVEVKEYNGLCEKINNLRKGKSPVKVTVADYKRLKNGERGVVKNGILSFPSDEKKVVKQKTSFSKSEIKSRYKRKELSRYNRAHKGDVFSRMEDKLSKIFEEGGKTYKRTT